MAARRGFTATLQVSPRWYFQDAPVRPLITGQMDRISRVFRILEGGCGARDGIADIPPVQGIAALFRPATHSESSLLFSKHSRMTRVMKIDVKSLFMGA